MKKVLTKLEAAGYEVTVVDDGEARTAVSSIKQALEEATAVDECKILCVKTLNVDYAVLSIVWGNSPEEVIADFSAPNEKLLEKVRQIIGQSYYTG